MEKVKDYWPIKSEKEKEYALTGTQERECEQRARKSHRLGGSANVYICTYKGCGPDQSFIDGVTHAHAKAPAAEQRFYIGLKLASQSVS